VISVSSVTMAIPAEMPSSDAATPQIILGFIIIFVFVVMVCTPLALTIIGVNSVAKPYQNLPENREYAGF